MRTTQEIVKHVRKIMKSDFLGFWMADLLEVLPFKDAWPFLDPTKIDETREAEWDAKHKEITDGGLRAQIVDYLPFALTKARNHRGISASRSICHFRAWCWLLGDDGAIAFLEDDDHYENYGAPSLKYLCGRYGVAYPVDEGLQRMARGETCVIGCVIGCGT